MLQQCHLFVTSLGSLLDLSMSIIIDLLRRRIASTNTLDTKIKRLLQHALDPQRKQQECTLILNS